MEGNEYLVRSCPSSAFVELLPVRIERAEIEEPTLLLGGVDWSLSVTCDWRWVKADGSVVSEGTAGREDLIWDLVGEEIVAAHWSGLERLGTDPSFAFRSGGALELFSDAAYDTWVLHTPSLILVGPLRG
jgi:hypothetical protein